MSGNSPDSLLQTYGNKLALPIGHKHPDGKGVWTKAIWTCFDRLRASLGPGWSLYPPSLAKGTVRADGEYLVDFMLMDDRLGPRTAFESDFGDISRIDLAFDKLRGMKSDIKVLILESDFAPEDLMPRR